MSFSDKGQLEMTMTTESGEKQTCKGPYSVDVSSSPLKITFVASDKKGYYAIAILPNDQIRMDEMKSPDQPARLGEDAFTLVRESK